MRLKIFFIALLFSGFLKSQCVMYMDSTSDCGFTCGGMAAAYSSGQAPFTYLWQPGGQTTQQITNLCPGSYTVIVTDSLGCVSVDSVTIHGSQIMNVWISSFTNPTCAGCNDGDATGSVNGGTPPYYPYWNPPIGFGVYTINGLCAGTYEFCVIDAYGCVSCVDTVLQDPALGFNHTSPVEITYAFAELYDLNGRLIWSGNDYMSEAIMQTATGAIHILVLYDNNGTAISRKR